MKRTERPATTVEVPQGAIVGDQIVPHQEITAVFTAPDGTELPVQIRLFQLGPTVGVGVYPPAACAAGVVLRWDDGPGQDPRVIYWRAPHCDDDECGAPCGHEDDQ